MLINVAKTEDILKQYRNTPIESLLNYHNLGQEFKEYNKAELLIAMCMDYRLHLHLPENFAYIIRTGGANLKHNDFNLAYSIAVGGIKHIALIGHNDCAMSHIASQKDVFVDGLVKNGGWNRDKANDYFKRSLADYDIGDEADFIIKQADLLRENYPAISIAPMIYLLEDKKLYLIEEKQLGIKGW